MHHFLPIYRRDLRQPSQKATNVHALLGPGQACDATNCSILGSRPSRRPHCRRNKVEAGKEVHYSVLQPFCCAQQLVRECAHVYVIARAHVHPPRTRVRSRAHLNLRTSIFTMSVDSFIIGVAAFFLLTLYVLVLLVLLLVLLKTRMDTLTLKDAAARETVQ